MGGDWAVRLHSPQPVPGALCDHWGLEPRQSRGTRGDRGQAGFFHRKTEDLRPFLTQILSIGLILEMVRRNFTLRL